LRSMQRRKMKSEGTCEFCGKTVSNTAMAKHLLSCEERKKSIAQDDGYGKAFLIRASAGPYFIYFEANDSATLNDVDKFLRKVWLECCGHMSQFTINGINYISSAEGSEKGMNFRLFAVLKEGLEFSHEYDFGTTTFLKLKVIAERNGRARGIPILARNNPPDIKCKCGKPATQVCPECIYECKAFFCDACAEEHECGEDMMLPVVNSPRMGMCGYTGD